MIIKTFKGNIANNGQDRIYLSGGEDDKGYRISKFEALPSSGSTDIEGVLKIYVNEQLVINPDIDFSEDNLLAALILVQDDNHENTTPPSPVVFDKEVVNQDIYVTWACHDKSGNANYYIELEEVTMPKGEQAVVNFKAALLHGE